MTPSRTTAWNPASKGKDGSAASVASLLNTLDTACGDGACDPHRANNARSGESRLSRKTPTTRTATSARSVLLFDFSVTTSRDALTSALSTFVDRFVHSLLNKVDERDENGKPTKASIVAADKLDNYLDYQMAMFDSRGLDKFRAYKEAVVPTGEYFTNRNGEQVEKFRIIVRDVKLEPVEDDKDGDRVAMARAAYSYSGAIGIERDTKRGKYNDAGLLIEQSSKSVDASEAVPFFMPAT